MDSIFIIRKGISGIAAARVSLFYGVYLNIYEKINRLWDFGARQNPSHLLGIH